MKRLISAFALLSLLCGCGAKDAGVSFVQDPAGRKIDVMVDGSLFTSLIYPEDVAKPILWPVMSASGKEITRGYPRAPRAFESTDHPHQIGIWFNFGDVNGLDFWNNSFAIPAEKLRVIYQTAVPNITVPIGSSRELARSEILYTDSTDYLLGGSLMLKNGRIDKYQFEGGYCQAEKYDDTQDIFYFCYYCINK